MPPSAYEYIEFHVACQLVQRFPGRNGSMIFLLCKQIITGIYLYSASHLKTLETSRFKGFSFCQGSNFFGEKTAGKKKKLCQKNGRFWG